ncbi:MAG: hypothetical protein RLZ75_1960 [Pseudomonadota bacterium]
MNTAELIYQESKELPEFEAREVLDFVGFLKAKRQRKLAAEQETADMSEIEQFDSVFDGHLDRQ